MSADPLSEQELDALNRLHKFAKTSNYYGILGISPGADASKIQAAYYQLSRDWHPDRHFRRKLGDDASRIEFVFVNITKAYKVLSDADARRRYHRDNKEIVALARAEEQDAERIARKKKARAKAGKSRSFKMASKRASKSSVKRARSSYKKMRTKSVRSRGRSSRSRGSRRGK